MFDGFPEAEDGRNERLNYAGFLLAGPTLITGKTLAALFTRWLKKYSSKRITPYRDQQKAEMQTNESQPG